MMPLSSLSAGFSKVCPPSDIVIGLEALGVCYGLETHFAVISSSCVSFVLYYLHLSSYLDQEPLDS